MPFKIVRKDITKIKVDAIVNSANPHAIVGGGVDYAINVAAGPKLIEERKSIGDIATGTAHITPAFNLKAKYVIHTVGPVWHGGSNNEAQYVSDCYTNSLKLAFENNCKSIAFPLISAGIFGFSISESLKIAMNVSKKFLLDHEMDIIVVVFDKSFNSLSDELVDSVSKYLDDNLKINRNAFNDMLHSEDEIEVMYTNSKISIADLMDELEDTFSESLLLLIKEKGKSEVEIYKKANIDRKLFSKIKSNSDYQPSKVTAISFAIALELDLGETTNLISKAGFAISHASKFDLIIEYCIKNSIFDVFDINEILFNYNLPLLGL